MWYDAEPMPPDAHPTCGGGGGGVHWGPVRWVLSMEQVISMAVPQALSMAGRVRALVCWCVPAGRRCQFSLETLKETDVLVSNTCGMGTCEKSFQPPASVVAGLLLLLRDFLPDWEGLPKTSPEILKLAGAGQTQPYAMRERLRELLPTVVRSPGRPSSRLAEPCEQCEQCPMMKIPVAIRDYLMAHPGSVDGKGERRTYSDDFRRFVVGLTGPGQIAEGMSDHGLADLVGVSRTTLYDWMHPKSKEETPSSVPPVALTEEPTAAEAGASEAAPSVNAPPAPEGGDEPPPSDVSVPSSEIAPEVGAESPDDDLAKISDAHMATVVRLWNAWEGTFQAFCDMVRTEHRIHFGDTRIRDILHVFGMRQPTRRTPVEAPWSSNTFRMLFPGAQWLGDGKDIVVIWGVQRFVFSLELMLDVASNAAVGLDVSKAESAKAVEHAYQAGKEACGGVPPIATSLDNKPCNHSPEAKAALDDTIVLRSTPGRGQAKAPLEGAFGLLEQELPPLIVTGDTDEEKAAEFLWFVVTAYYTGRNGRPRRRMGGLSPAQAYANARLTPEDIERATRYFRELQDRDEQARLTRDARLDPVRIALLTQGLAKLGIPDPDNSLAKSLAYYCRDAIVRGLATFESKRDVDTIPAKEADHGRYLGGIIRNLHTQLELDRFSIYIMEQRLRCRDLTLEPLKRAAGELRSTLPVIELPQAFVDRALNATYAVDFRFWAQSANDALAALPAASREKCYQALTLRVSASFKVDQGRRADLIDSLAEALATAA